MDLKWAAGRMSFGRVFQQDDLVRVLSAISPDEPMERFLSTEASVV